LFDRAFYLREHQSEIERLRNVVEGTLPSRYSSVPPMPCANSRDTARPKPEPSDLVV
jgi:hypothetical protein